MTRDTSDTPRRTYDRPPIGDDWAASWDALVEDLDKHVVERGVLADRPATGEYDNELYLATDDQTLYRWDDSAASWAVAISSGGSTKTAVSAELSANQSIPSGTPTQIAFDETNTSSTFDERDEFDTTANKFVADEAGRYDVRLSVVVSVDTAGDEITGDILVNGAKLARKSKDAQGSSADGVTLGRLVELSAGDEITAEVTQGSGNQQQVLAATQGTFLTIHRVD
jgi:hypothetical protein